ncbi:MAG TPA: bifunctional ADP-heptose synthase [Thermoanaerobaculia bacterium]|nr:bifunctional ADP-heptose synthase [Thermoanaerobaculia bacterium]
MNRALPSAGRLRDLIAAFEGREVLVFADLVADRFVAGRARRISREAPVLILDQESDAVVPGGGANAVSNIRALGGRPLLLGSCGDDPEGRALVAALVERGVDVGHVLERSGYRTPTKTRVLGGGTTTTVKQQIVRIDSGDRRDLSDSELDRYRTSALRLLSADRPPAVAVFSDYGYGSVAPGLLSEVRAHSPGAVTLVDSRYRLRDFAGATGATPNQEEAEAILGVSLDDDDSLRQHGPELRRRLGLEFLLITRGSRGMALFLEDRRLFLPVSGGDEVADVTGAGDTVIGAFSLAVAAGASPAEATAIANLAGGVVVHKQGTATASASELLRALDLDRDRLEEVEWDAS